MRLTFLLSSLQLAGGNRVIVEYANRLARRGHICTLVAPGGSIDPELRGELDAGVRLIESRVLLEEKMGALALARLTLSLARLAPASDVVFSTHTPTVVAGFIATHILRKGKAAWFYQDYAAMFAERPVELWLMRHALRWHEAAFVNSRWAGGEIGSQGADKIVVTGVGVSGMEHFIPMYANERMESTPRTIVTMGDTRPRKGFADLVAATRLLSVAHDQLAITVVSREPLDFDIGFSSRVVLRPDRAELAHILQECALFVLASRWESLGLPPLEAMACAAPVVLVDSGGVRDYAVDGENCLLVPPQDAHALASAIMRVLGDPPLAQRLSQAGPPTAARYDWDYLTERFERQLLALVRGEPASAISALSMRQ